MGKDNVPNSIHFTWHKQNGINGAVTLVSSDKGPNVLDGQFLQLINSKAKFLNNDCVGTLQLNRKDIAQTV
jgi:hypothetical protein